MKQLGNKNSTSGRRELIMDSGVVRLSLPLWEIQRLLWLDQWRFVQLSLECVWGGVKNHSGFENKVNDSDHYSKNNGKNFKAFKQDTHMIKFRF